MQQNLDLAGGADLRATLVDPSRGTDYALRDDEIIIDAFCGAGGLSCGVEDALGRSPDVAINHWDVAIATHAANHPATAHYRASVYGLDPRDLVPEGKSVGLLWASPDCFTAGTLVLTKDGLKAIEDVKVDDLVLTHKGRWRRVTKRWSQISRTVEVRGQGHYGLVTTPGHGFYSKRVTTRWPAADKETGARLGARRTLVEDPYWPEAATMKGRLWATPRSFPETAMPTCPDAEYGDDFFYFFGRWLGDGSINKGDVEIRAGLDEAQTMRTIFSDAPLRNAAGDAIQFRTVDHRTTMAFAWGCASLAQWLEREAGRLCEDRCLPVWCLSMQQSWRAAMLRGYLDADGSRQQGSTGASSVSKALAVGMRLLATSLGKTVSLSRRDGAPDEIEGRSFMGRDSYVIGWMQDNQKQNSHQDEQHTYTPVREVVEAGERQVHCLQVEEDESFVADGIVVHNCREFSRAKNGAPRSPSIRMLADSVVHYARMTKPRIIGMENVVEFEDAGPLDRDGRIIKERKGEIFQAWVAALRALGYVVDWTRLNAAHYGAPTLRTRFFLQARLDGLPIVWPEPTHGDPAGEGVRSGRLLPWRTAAECLEFDRPVHSIFLDKADARKVRCKRPLADSSLRRIARGIFRDVVNKEDPFIITYYGERRDDESFRGGGLNKPFATTTAGGNRFGLVVPLTHQGSDRVYSTAEPFRTITGAHRGELAYVAATMIHTGYGEREGQAPRALDVQRPLGTVVAAGVRHAVVAATLTCFNQNAAGSMPDTPLKTIVAGATRHAYIEGQIEGGIDRSAQVAQFLWDHRHLSEKPVTRTEDGRVLVDGRPINISDIGLRMVAPSELARAQGFNDDPAKGRVFDPNHRADGTPNSKEDIVKMIGNSVSPPVGSALIRSMFGIETEQMRIAA